MTPRQGEQSLTAQELETIALRRRVRELEAALRDLLDACKCGNDCEYDDMTCATNRARRAVAGGGT